MRRLVVSSGAGISAESGMSTYRDAGGLWDTYPVMEVASVEGYLRNPALIHQFYSKMRTKLAEQIKPNAAHYAVAELERRFHVDVMR